MNTSHIKNSSRINIYRQKFGRLGLWTLLTIMTATLMLLTASSISHAHNAGFLTMGIRLHDVHITESSETEQAENNPKEDTTEAYMPTAGIAEVEHTDIDDFGTLDVAVWFPTTRMAQTITVGRWQFQAARNAKPVDGRFPLVIISHDAGEMRLSHHNLANFLAQNGFVVAALTHPHDCTIDMSAMFTLQQVVHRPQHVTRLLDALLANPKTKDMIDSTHIAFIGFGVGGTTGLTLAGAVPSPSQWPSYCNNALPTDIYCGPWARQRLDTMTLALADALAVPETKAVKTKTAKTKKQGVAENIVTPIYPKMPQLQDSRIHSFTLITPSYGMFFPASALRNVTAPILLVQSEYDSMNHKTAHAEALRVALPTTPEFFHLKEAGHFSLRDEPSLAPRHSGLMPDEEDIASLEPRLSPEDKAATQDYVQNRILHFLENTLK